jgi:nitrile hydratase subunit beta
MGGMDGFGAVVREENEPAFHFDWERRAFGIALAAGAAANTDEFRHAIERIPASRYLNSSYYERWLDGIQILLLEKGLVSREELVLRGAELVTASQPPNRFEGTAPKTSRTRARFHKGDRVIARNLNSSGHTRLARYVRAKRGVIWRDWGIHVFPDSNAHGAGKRSQHVYCVAFKARELWGAQAASRDCVYIDLWEEYLEPGKPPPKSPNKKRFAATGRRKTR